MSGYFRVTQKQSGGGGGATITVSYSAAYYGKTITCSDGVTTYTATTTSSGSTTFNVNAEGTWTITCDGTTKTVNVVLSYTTEMSITKTITVYSAANDTVSFTDATGSKTVTTDSTGAGSASITYNDGDVITFTSSVANDPYDLTSYYSKSITLETATTEIYVMPDNALYWYGYIGEEAEEMLASNGWTYPSYTYVAPTYNTNYVLISSTNSKICGISTKTKKVTTGDKVNAIAEGVTIGSGVYGWIQMTSSKTSTASTTLVGADITSNSKAAYQAVISSGNWFPCMQTSNARAHKLYAFWYE